MVLAQTWHDQLQTGRAKSRAELARQLSVSRAHVTQVLRLLDVAPAAKELIVALGDPVEGGIVGVHTLGSLAGLPAEEQERRVLRIVERTGRGTQRQVWS